MRSALSVKPGFPRLPFLLAVVLLVGASLCSPGVFAATTNVNVNNFTFTPKNPIIHTGDTIHWQLVAGAHTTTSGTAVGLILTPDGLWNSDIDLLTTSFDRQFNSVGTFTYYCNVHGSIMTGSIIVQAANQAPVVTNPGTKNGTEGLAFSVTVTATDPDGNPLVMSSPSGVPAWATFTDNGNKTATIQGTPSFSQSGTYPVSVKATDPGLLSDTETFDIVIANNVAPVVTNPGTQNGQEGIFFTVTVSATDLHTVTMASGGKPAWATFTDNGNKTATIQGTPPFGSAGTYPDTVLASDPEPLIGNAIFNIVVAPTDAVVINVSGQGALAGLHGVQSAAETFMFDPAEVTIPAGGKVAWNWVNGSHTTTSGVSSDPSHNPGALWDQVVDVNNKIYFRTFSDPGVFPYFCRPHEPHGMRGRIIVQATGLGVGDGVASAQGRFLRAFPNPFAGAVDVSFRLEQREAVTFDVFDLEGRSVRRLEAGVLEAGDHTQHWDGSDDGGRSVAAGVYLVRARGESLSAVTKVFKTR